MNSEGSQWQVSMIVTAVLFSGFSAAHLIDDFVAGVPGEFNLSVPATEGLALAYMVALVGLVVAASGGSRVGYTGLVIAGVLIATAQLVKSVPEILEPGPWRAGAVSEFLSIGLLVTASLTALSSYQLSRGSKPRHA